MGVGVGGCVIELPCSWGGEGGGCGSKYYTGGTSQTRQCPPTT